MTLKSRLLAIVGPTSSGKTTLAIELAKEIDAEIISADSRQIYNQLNIGTGKPTKEQLKIVPHHLIAAISPNQIMTADHFAKMAKKHYEGILKRKPYCLLVGGTGLWIQALIDGMAQVPPADPEFRQQLKTRIKYEGPASLYKELEQIDPESASKLFPADTLRVIRALEIFKLTGKKASYLRNKKALPSLDASWIGLEWSRAELYARGEQKVDQWIASGWVDEVKQLMDKGLLQQAPAMQAIGYAHFYRYLLGEETFDKTVELVKRDTRRYIKRQLTWFRRNKRIQWYSGKDINAAIKSIVQKLLSKDVAF